jgi:hypothetical protein
MCIITPISNLLSYYARNKMKKNLNTSLIIGGLIALGAAGTLYALTIPTTPAKHDAYLTELTLGNEGTQTLKLDEKGQDRLIIPEKLIAGSSENEIAESARFAVIAGGGGVGLEKNSIGANAHNAVIGAGKINKVNAPNASIGAGRNNTITDKADRSIIGGGSRNTISSPNTSIG